MGRSRVSAAMTAACLTVGFAFALSAQQALAAAEKAGSQGMTWESLASLPDWLNAQWIPQPRIRDEKYLLKTIAYPPLKPEFVSDAKARIANILKGQESLPTADCRTEGQPRLAWYPHPLQFMYGAGNVMIQVAYQVRQINVGGIKHSPDLTDPNALVGLSVNGDAKGVWDGDTLVIDTVAVRDDIDTFYGVPNDPDLHVVERYRLIDRNTLERQTTVDAPNTFTRPWVVKTTYKREVASTLASQFCEPKGGWFSEGKGADAVPQANGSTATKKFTPNMTWESIQKLPRLWGVGWASPEEYDATQIVLTALQYPTFKSEYLAKSKARVQRIIDGKAEFKQASCAPNGMARSIWYTFSPVFLFQPGDRLIIASAGEFREVFMDGRAHPKNLNSNAPEIKYNGHSIGWWEGETLVVDTVGVHPGHELFYGVAYGGPSHIVERYELVADGKLKATVTVDAPAVLAQPWVFTRTFNRRPSASGFGPRSPDGGGGGAGSMLCNREDSRQKVDAEGNVYLDLTPPRPASK